MEMKTKRSARMTKLNYIFYVFIRNGAMQFNAYHRAAYINIQTNYTYTIHIYYKVEIIGALMQRLTIHSHRIVQCNNTINEINTNILYV